MLDEFSAKENLARFKRRPITANHQRLAAVAVVLTSVDGELAFALTRRSRLLKRNPGNFALPGGNKDPTDRDLIETAVRETHEEIGVSLQRQRQITTLDDFQTLSGHLVTPIVFWHAGRTEFSLNPDEVDDAWWVPIADLAHPGSPRTEIEDDTKKRLLQMHVRGRWINAPTAAWLFQFREALFSSRSVRVNQIPQPEWTRI